MTARVALAARLDLPAAAPLAEEIRARAGSDIEIDASAVSHLGGLCLQVLIAAAAAWREAGNALTVSAMSEDFTAALAVFGLTPEALISEKHA
jgi:chemotaxis protein CheX